jgi:hypothetical protein
MVRRHYDHDVLHVLREQVRRKRLSRWRKVEGLLHSDNAPAHGLSVQQCFCARSVSAEMRLSTVCQCNNAPAHGLSVQQFLPAKRMPFLPHPPYSPDFFLCPRKKSHARDRRFQGVPEIYEQSLSSLHAVRKSQFQRCFQQ